MLLKNTEENLNNLSLEEEMQLIVLAKNSLKYKQIVYDNWSKLVASVAKKYVRDTVPLSDLMQEGFMGIDRAINDYNPDHKKRFSTYARGWIYSFIIEYYRKNARIFKISGSISSKLYKLLNINIDLEQKLGRAPTVFEISNKSGISEGHINYLKRFLHTTDLPIQEIGDGEYEENQTEHSYTLPDNHSDSPAERLVRTNGIESLRNALNRLGDAERFVLVSRYGLDGEDELTLAETGSKMKGKLTAERVRQIQVQAETKLKRYLNK